MKKPNIENYSKLTDYIDDLEKAYNSLEEEYKSTLLAERDLYKSFIKACVLVEAYTGSCPLDVFGDDYDTYNKIYRDICNCNNCSDTFEKCWENYLRHEE